MQISLNTWILWKIVAIILFSVKSTRITFLQDQGVVRSMALPVGKSTPEFPPVLTGVDFCTLPTAWGKKLRLKKTMRVTHLKSLKTHKKCVEFIYFTKQRH